MHHAKLSSHLTPPLPELSVTTNPRDVMAPGFTYFGGHVIRRSGDGKAVWQRAQPYRSAALLTDHRPHGPAAAGGSGVEQVACAVARAVFDLAFWAGFLTWFLTWISNKVVDDAVGSN